MHCERFWSCRSELTYQATEDSSQSIAVDLAKGDALGLARPGCHKP
jgi:hypothetical protein